MDVNADIQVKTFQDVSENHVYNNIIEEMATEGIINGYEDGTFKHDEQISRQHGALFVSRAVNLKPTVGFKQFKDISSTHV